VIKFNRMNSELGRGYKHDKNTVLQEEGEERHRFLNIGDTISIGDKEHVIEKVAAARELGAEFGLDIPDDIPIYWLADVGGVRKGAFVPEANIVLFFENTDRETQHHELTHAVEYFQEMTLELIALYERVKGLVTEDSFGGGLVSFNFMKNIHEFIADGRTKSVFIEALKKEGLYDEFVNETEYLFEESQAN
jgi:hypothetical protein